MKAGPRELEKGELLFREGDPSDAAYVIKSGRLSITKSKGNSEIVLAELGPGSMLGEMAFFDNKPRSAGAKATTKSVVIALPFKALNAQFKTFPEWLKVMVKTINQHLRDANQRIKNAEKAPSEDDAVFDPYTITRLISILTLVAHRFGTHSEEGWEVPTGTLRRHTIQIFQQPTNKMVKLNEVLSAMGYVELTDLGEGRQKLVVKDLDLLSNFAMFYNEYLFKEESKRTTIEERELPILRALKFYANKSIANGEQIRDDGKVSVSLTDMQNDSMKDLNYLVKVEAVDTLIDKGICSEKLSGPKGITMDVNVEEITPLIDYWSIVYTLLNYAPTPGS